MSRFTLSDLPLSGLKLVERQRFGDSRGFLSRLFCAEELAAAGWHKSIAQVNYSHTSTCGTVRGMHFQLPPYAEMKLVSCLRGKVWDVAVDLRRNSPWYGKHVAAELSANNWQQLLIPAGFAHGFCTLEPDTVVLYKVDAFYSAPHDQGVRWDDPDLAIAWPVGSDAAILSEKDQHLPLLGAADAPFDYEVDNACD